MPKPLQDMVNTKARRPQQVVLPPTQYPKAPVQNRSRYFLWTVAMASAAFLLLAVSFLLGSATVEVFPKSETVTLSEDMTATKTPATRGLAFDLVILSGEKSKIINATEEKEIAEEATGTVVIFNDYGTATQRLDINTRLSGSNGKLYKTKEAVVVPGRSSDGVPGAVEVGIYAGEPGEAFNAGPLDFNVVGFKGTPKYDKFKVRTKTGTEISGGFVGKSLVATEADKDKARQELTAALEAELLEKATDQIPDGFILFPKATAFTVDKVDLPLGGEELEVTVNGTLYGILFDESELAKTIAEEKVGDYADEDIFIPNIRDLQFTLASAPGATLEELQNISFNLSGKAEVVWKLDEEKFQADLLGRSKKDFTSILSPYEAIDRAELTLSPIWQRTIPDEAEKVKIIVRYLDGE